jgi:hypothetical protein
MYGTKAAAAKPPLLTPTAAGQLAGSAEGRGSLGFALAAGAAVALVGGLVWAQVVISTHRDFGFLAWFVGAATGATVAGVYGRPSLRLGSVLAGLLAVGGLVVGKYVIFVHAVKATLGSLLAVRGVSVGYFDTRQMSIFIHHFSSIVRPIYGLWFLIAFVAAFMTAERRTLLGRRRAR